VWGGNGLGQLSCFGAKARLWLAGPHETELKDPPRRCDLIASSASTTDRGRPGSEAAVAYVLDVSRCGGMATGLHFIGC
jgi:hypothetical protein